MPMAWSPLGGGGLMDGSKPALVAALKRIAGEQGVDEAAVAVAWLLAHPARIAPVLGTNTIARIEKIGEAAKVEIDRQPGLNSTPWQSAKRYLDDDDGGG